MAYTVAIVIMGPNANDKEYICVWVYIAVCFTCILCIQPGCRIPQDDEDHHDCCPCHIISGQ